MSGYVAMRRDWQEHAVFGADEFSRRDAWAWLIAQAAWKPMRTRIKGSVIDLDRGELCFSVRFLATKWRWSKSRVDRFISTLRAEGMIRTRSKSGTPVGHPAGQGQSILTVCNYEKFQAPLKPQRDATTPYDGTTAGQQRDKEEEGNQGTKVELPPNGADDLAKSLFDTGVQIFMRKGVTEGRARAVIAKAQREHGDAAALAAINQVRGATDPVSAFLGRLGKARRQEEYNGV